MKTMILSYLSVLLPQFYRFGQGLVLFVLLTLLLTRCNTDDEVLTRKIRSFLRTDCRISLSEYEQLDSIISNDKTGAWDELLDSTTGKVQFKALREFVRKTAQGMAQYQGSDDKGNPKVNCIQFDEQWETGTIKKTIVFIENSGSMDGYVKNITRFETALSDLFVQVTYHFKGDDFEINFINAEVIPSGTQDVRSFIRALEPDKKPYHTGYRKTSQLTDVFEKALHAVQKDQLVILVSDCIFSLEKPTDTESALGYEKNLLKKVFLDYSKQTDFSAMVLKMTSGFNGKYYRKNNDVTELYNIERPYYIWFFGTPGNIKEMLNDISTQKLPGFQQQYLFSADSVITKPSYGILKMTGVIGEVEPANWNSIEEHTLLIGEYANKQVQFTVAANLSSVIADKTFMLDINNYKPLPEGYKLVKVDTLPLHTVKSRDRQTIDGLQATHLFTISCQQQQVHKPVTIALRNGLPGWVARSSTTDDVSSKTIDPETTFGFAYLVNGISEAYQSMRNGKESFYFKLELTIKNK